MALLGRSNWRLPRRGGRVLPAEAGVTLAPDRQGPGLVTEALGAIVSTLFEDHHMHRVFGQVDDRVLPARTAIGHSS